MITKLDIHSAQGGFLSLPLEDASAGFVVEEIQGTEPVKATLSSTSFAQQDGARYNSSRREARNLLLKVGLEPDWAVNTVRDLRSRLYSVFMPKSAVDIDFVMIDGLQVVISGRVESFECPMFTEEPVADISVMCFDPDFIDPDPILINGVTTAGSSTTDFSYAGTVETGILFKIMPDRSLSEFTIYHQASDGFLRTMDFQAALLAGDVVTISTVSGSKFARRTRDGVDTSVLYGVAPEANWTEFTPGTNSVRVYAAGDPVPYTIEYRNRYGGL
jgi:hypothetical protein